VNEPDALRLDLGAGETVPAGYTPLGNHYGKPIYPLNYADGSVGTVRASHILEHYSHRDIGNVLAEWVRVLKPGGTLKVAVPDFRWVAERYLAGEDVNVQGYVMGGHVDAADHHGCIFDEEALREALEAAGLVDIRPWKSEIEDCAALPVSLNLMGTKPPPVAQTSGARLKVAAAISVPRLGFQDNFLSIFEALVPLGISLRRHTGAFWGQCLTRCFEEILAEDCDLILTVDYDTIFSRAHVAALIGLMQAHPEVDALAPVQASRHAGTPLFTIRGADGKGLPEVPRETFDGELTPLATAHFGLTLIRAAALRDVPQPWFCGQPATDGTWGEGRTDDDIWFWKQWAKAGKTLCLANRVPVGHAELMVRWPDLNLETIYQAPNDFWKSGPPETVWK